MTEKIIIEFPKGVEGRGPFSSEGLAAGYASVAKVG
jgi:hypothetical protein